MTTLVLADASATFPILTALVVLPLFGAVLLLALPSSRPELFKQVALLISVTTGAMSLWMMAAFETDAADQFQFVDRQSWIDGLGISWLLGVDGISLFLVVLTGVLFPIALAGADAEHSPKAYYAWMLVLEAGCMGVFLALDLFAFFVFFEIVLVPMYFLIGQWGHGARAYAATKFFLFTMFGSAR